MSHRYNSSIEAMRKASLRLEEALKAYKRADQEAHRDIEEAFDAATLQERADAIEEELLNAKLEAMSLEEESGPPLRRSNPLWAWRKRR